MSDDSESKPRRQVPWLGIASLLVTVVRLLHDLWRKGRDRGSRVSQPEWPTGHADRGRAHGPTIGSLPTVTGPPVRPPLSRDPAAGGRAR